MNVNDFYQGLFEDTLGLDVYRLEGRYTELVRLIDRKTLKTFGNLIPAFYLTYIDLSDESHIVKKEHHTHGVEYYIDDPVLTKFRLPILGVESVQYNNVGNVDPYDPDSTAFYNSVYASRNNVTLEGVLMGSEYTYSRTLTDTALPYKRYNEFRGGRILYLENWGYTESVEVKIKTKWPNIVSIPEEYQETFTTLAKYDIQMKLWNELKYLEDVPTPTGNLQLRFDWSGAERDREDFLKELRMKSLPDRVGAVYFHIL